MYAEMFSKIDESIRGWSNLAVGAVQNKKQRELTRELTEKQLREGRRQFDVQAAAAAQTAEERREIYKDARYLDARDTLYNKQKLARQAEIVRSGINTLQNIFKTREGEVAQIKQDYENALAASGGDYTAEVEAAATKYSQAVGRLEAFKNQSIGRLNDIVASQETTIKRVTQDAIKQGALEINEKMQQGIDQLDLAMKQMKENAGYSKRLLSREMSKADKAVEQEYKRTEKELAALKREARNNRRQLQGAAAQRGLGFSQFVMAGTQNINDQFNKARVKARELSKYRLGELDDRKLRISDQMLGIDREWSQGMQNIAMKEAELTRGAMLESRSLRTRLAAAQADNLNKLAQFGFGQEVNIHTNFANAREQAAAQQTAMEAKALDRRRQAQQAALARYDIRGIRQREGQDALASEVLQLGVEAAAAPTAQELQEAELAKETAYDEYSLARLANSQAKAARADSLTQQVLQAEGKAPTKITEAVGGAGKVAEAAAYLPKEAGEKAVNQYLAQTSEQERINKALAPSQFEAFKKWKGGLGRDELNYWKNTGDYSRMYQDVEDRSQRKAGLRFGPRTGSSSRRIIQKRTPYTQQELYNIWRKQNQGQPNLYQYF